MLCSYDEDSNIPALINKPDTRQKGCNALFKIHWLCSGSLNSHFGVLMYKGDLPSEVVDAKYSNEQSRFLDIASGARIHFRDEGNPSGRALVLIHGSNASLHTWEPWVQRLGDEFRIITLDLPGHGLTGRVPGDDYSSTAFVETINAVVEHLGVNTFALGGNSMGGGATWRYTLAYPEKVSAMILIDASGLPQWWSERVQSSDVDNERRPLAFTLLSKLVVSRHRTIH